MQALTRAELFGVGHGTGHPRAARDALLDAHTAIAPLLATFVRSMQRQRYRCVCTTLEQLARLLCEDADAVAAFVTAGGVSQLWRVLTLDPAELAAHYRTETRRRPRDPNATALFNLIMSLAGHNAPHSPPPQPESDSENEDDIARQGEQEESGVIGDPALERFDAEDRAENEEWEADDLYVPPSVDNEGVASMMRIAASLINQPRHSEWLLTALRKQSVLILREAAYNVEVVSKETVRSPSSMATLLHFLDDKQTFFMTIPLLEELSAENVARCNLAPQSLCSSIPPLNPPPDWLCNLLTQMCSPRVQKSSNRSRCSSLPGSSQTCALILCKTKTVCVSFLSFSIVSTSMTFFVFAWLFFSSHARSSHCCPIPGTNETGRSR